MKKEIFIIIYLILYFFLVLFILFSNNLALVLSPVFPLMFIIKYYRGLSSIYDYRFIYLLSLFIWGLGKSLSLLISDNAEIDFSVMFIYTNLMFICPLLVLFFKFDINILFPLKKFKNSNFPLIAAWFLSCLILFCLKYFNSESNINFIVENLFRSLPIYFGAALLLKNENKKGYISFFSLIVIILTIIPYTINSYNRSAILFPFSILALSIFLIKIGKNLNYHNLKSKIFVYSIILILVLILSDLTKQRNLSIFDSLSSLITNNVSSNIIQQSNYLPELDSAINYFNTLERVNEHQHGIILYQLISSLTPRIFFPTKSETDISKILFENGISPQPLYFEIFLEPYYDSGILGVLFYFIVYLLFSCVLFKFIKYSNGYSLIFFAKSLYLISLVVLFYCVRGPAITIAQFMFVPIAVFTFQNILFKRKIKLD